MINQSEMLGFYAWLFDKFELDDTGVRILFITAVVLVLGSPLLIYIFLYLIKPNIY
jgi:phage shock protein PspC (stress-responsive transcriptional regulator)